MKRLAILAFVLLAATTAFASGRTWQTGKLLDINFLPVHWPGSLHELFFSVRIDNMVYTGSCYELPKCNSTDWIVGDDIKVSIEKNTMYLQKPDGDESKTSIVKRARANTIGK